LLGGRAVTPSGFDWLLTPIIGLVSAALSFFLLCAYFGAKRHCDQLKLIHDTLITMPPSHRVGTYWPDNLKH
jgi:phosphate/sulfate permease